MIQPDEIIRSDRKTLAISIDSFGRLIVRAPKRCGEGRIFAFIQAKENWILRKQAEKAQIGIQLPKTDLNGYELFLLGEKRKIVLVDGVKIIFDRESGNIFLPSKNAKRRLIAWLKENAKRIFTQVTERKALEMSVCYKSLDVSSARGRWGACSHDNALHYTFRLLYCSDLHRLAAGR